jgi:hypothetical protein
MTSDNKLFLRVLDQKQNQMAKADPEELNNQLIKMLKFQMSKENINVMLQKARGMIANTFSRDTRT